MNEVFYFLQHILNPNLTGQKKDGPKYALQSTLFFGLVWAYFDCVLQTVLYPAVGSTPKYGLKYAQKIRLIRTLRSGELFGGLRKISTRFYA